MLLALAAGLPGARVTDAEVLSSGTQHRVLRLALDRPPGRVVARLADPAAAPAVDLARTAAASALAGPVDGDLARTAFWDGLPDLEPDGPVRVPERRLHVLQLLWCLEREDGSARHAADTAALCRRLGVLPPVGTG